MALNLIVSHKARNGHNVVTLVLRAILYLRQSFELLCSAVSHLFFSLSYEISERFVRIDGRVKMLPSEVSQWVALFQLLSAVAGVQVKVRAVRVQLEPVDQLKGHLASVGAVHEVTSEK